MKSQFLNIIKVATLAAILAASVSAVSAFTGPTASAPTQSISYPVNVSSDTQVKKGSFISELFLKAGDANPFALVGAAAKGWMIAEDSIVSPWAFSYKTFLPGNDSFMKIGSNSSDPAEFTDAVVPLTVDLIGRGGVIAPTSGHEAIEFLADTNYCNTQTTVRTDTPGIQFWSTKNNTNADVIARQLQLNGGNPAKNKVLISTDAEGNATWATVKVTGTTISYTDYETESIVAIDQSSCAEGTPPIYVPVGNQNL